MRDLHEFGVAVKPDPGTVQDLHDDVAGLNQPIRGKPGDSLIDGDALGGWVEWGGPVQTEESAGNLRIDVVSFGGEEYLPDRLVEGGDLAGKQRALRQRRGSQGTKVLFFQVHQLAQRVLPQPRIIAAKLNDQGLQPGRIGPPGRRKRQNQRKPERPRRRRGAAKLPAMTQEKTIHEV